MAAIVGALRAVLSLESAAFQKGLKQSQTALAGFSKRMNAIGGRATDLGQKLSVVSAAMAAAGAAAFALAKGGADAMDKIGNSAKAAGLSAKAYQEMAFAMGEAADISQDDFDAAMVRLNRTLGDAKGGSASAIAAFEAIGISQQQIASGSVGTEQALAALIARLEATKDPAEAAALATDFFGKAGARIGGMLAGSEGQVKGFVDRARELGIAMSDDAVAAAGQFNNKLAELSRQFELVKMKVAEALLPVLVDTLIPALQKTVLPAFVALAEKVGDVVQWFGDLPAPVQEVAGVIATAFALGGPALLAVGALATAIGAVVGALSAPAVGMIAVVALASAALVTWGDDIKTAVGGAVDWVVGKFDALMAKVQGIIDKAIALKNAIVEALTYQPGDGQVQNQTGYDPGMRSSGSMAGIGADLAGGLVQGVGDGLADKKAELQGYLDQVTEQAEDGYETHSPSRVFRRIGQWLTEGLSLGIGDNTPMATAAIDDVAGAISGRTGSLESALESFRSTAESAFVGLVTGATSFKEALSQLASTLAQMAARSLFGSLFGGLFPNAAGNAFSNGRVTAFAAGGVVSSPTLFGMKGGAGLMGEAGPEAIMPLTRVGGKLGVQAAGRGSVELVVRKEPGVVAEIARAEAVSVVQAGISEYDRKVLPTSLNRYGRDPRRKN